jgi:hypothetical protein
MSTGGALSFKVVWAVGGVLMFCTHCYVPTFHRETLLSHGHRSSIMANPTAERPPAEVFHDHSCTSATFHRSAGMVEGAGPWPW